MGGCEDVEWVDQGSSADVNAFLGVLLQNGHLPGILAWSPIRLPLINVLDIFFKEIRINSAV